MADAHNNHSTMVNNTVAIYNESYKYRLIIPSIYRKYHIRVLCALFCW